MAASERLPYDLTMIPPPSLFRVARIFTEGDKKYGNRAPISQEALEGAPTPGNWRSGVHEREYHFDRANHAMKHLLIYIHWLETGEYLGEVKNGEREDDLAKVAWFCLTEMELNRLAIMGKEKS